MKSNLIVMLTHNDRTLKEALQIFEECRDLPIEYWGFKDVGISEEEMSELICAMNSAGKKTVLEVVTYTEESCMRGAQFACEHRFDYLLGTLFYPSVWDYVKTQPIQYYPFIGDVSGNPSILKGSLESMVSQADALYEMNIPGIDILAYRYNDGNPTHLAQNVVAQTKLNTIVAGSIGSIERINTISAINPWGFTIGSALYTQNFVSGGGYRANLEKVLEVLNSISVQVA